MNLDYVWQLKNWKDEYQKTPELYTPGFLIARPAILTIPVRPLPVTCIMIPAITEFKVDVSIPSRTPPLYW